MLLLLQHATLLLGQPSGCCWLHMQLVASCTLHKGAACTKVQVGAWIMLQASYCSNSWCRAPLATASSMHLAGAAIAGTRPAAALLVHAPAKLELQQAGTDLLLLGLLAQAGTRLLHHCARTCCRCWSTSTFGAGPLGPSSARSIRNFNSIYCHAPCASTCPATMWPVDGAWSTSTNTTR